MQDLNRLSLNALRAIEVLARHGRLAEAAAELGVTIGAVSQRVIEAERQLGIPLFLRGPQGMEPTVACGAALPHLAEGFRQLAVAAGRLRPADARSVTLSVAPIFAARWLIWRLPKFQAAHPEIRVRLETSVTLADPDRDGVDICFRVGRGGWPRVRAEKVFDQVIFPVCAPALAARLRGPADLAGLPVIRDPASDYDWEDWLKPEGFGGQSLGDGPSFSDSSMCLDAAISGAGVYLAFEGLANHALGAGSLVAPFAGRHATRNSYYIVTSEMTPPSGAARAFAAWLRAEIAGAGLGR